MSTRRRKQHQERVEERQFYKALRRTLERQFTVSEGPWRPGPWWPKDHPKYRAEAEQESP